MHDAKYWSILLAPHREPSTRHSVGQFVLTLSLYLAGWTAMYWTLTVSIWLMLPLAIPTAFMLIRLFIIQHDCGHGAFLKNQKWADRIGAFLGVLSLTPYAYWRKTHALHHATSGNLEHRGFGDIDTITVAEYQALGFWQRVWYRTYRHPVALFGIGAVLHFLVRHRFPGIVPRHWTRERNSILLTNIGIAAFYTIGSLVLGFREFWTIYLAYTVVSCPVGVWLFYVQHQFEPTYWEHDPDWQYDSAALQGSSYYALPRWLQWVTGHIGIHHVHHLNPKIPNYRLQEALDAHPELQQVTRLTLRESLKCVPLALWDEEQRRLVPFPS